MLVAGGVIVAAGIVGYGQTPEHSIERSLTIAVEPDALTLAVGETAGLTATVTDAAGDVITDAAVMYYSRSRHSVGVSRSGVVEAHSPGQFTVVALVPRDAEDSGRRPEAVARVEVPVTVPPPPVDRVAFVQVPPRFYARTRTRFHVDVVDTLGTSRRDVPVAYSASDVSIAEIGPLGYVTLRKPGRVEVTASAETAEARLTIDVVENPITNLELQSSADSVRTGDVVRFTAVAKDARGLAVRSVPVQFGVTGETGPTIIAAGASAMITGDGQFVAERSGTYTVVASTGTHSAVRTVTVTSRDVTRALDVVGRGKVLDRHTSDLWIWEGSDGRDYGITGTWGADGHAYVWDVTDPAHIVKLHEVQVDARTVNDVKVSEAGDIAVISREGASDRRNGIVVLGVGNPKEGVPVLSEFSDQLTGGVHNVFISESRVFALSAGRRYDVISIEDPRNPTRVGGFELETPGHAVHDVWVSEGVAFSSNWRDGIVAVDVGGGGRGGTPENPVELGRYGYPSGWNHAAFPYKSRSTGKFYVFAGDEWFPYGGFHSKSGSTPSKAEGWIHIIDWSNWENPREVARYQVPEAGSHNMWVEDDIMYVGYYNGGLRVVDVSGELLGDLYKQGREIAKFVPYDSEGFIPNSPFVWGPQPYKGHIFFTDWNSGLWAVKLLPKTGATPVIGEPQ